MIQNNVIRSDDPQAVEKLQAKLDKLTKQHARMKEINAYFKKHATALGCPGLSDAEATKLDERVQTGYSWEKQPYPSYILSGNTAEMRRLRQRIEEVSRTQNTEYVGWDFPGGHAEADKEDNRLRLYFDGKPTEEQRSKLKYNGFKWAPSVGAWQRQLNDSENQKRDLPKSSESCLIVKGAQTDTSNKKHVSARSLVLLPIKDWTFAISSVGR